MAVVLSSPTHAMTPSILLRPPAFDSPMIFTHPTPASSSSSSSSASSSGSCLDLNRSSSVPSTRRIRFAPLPDPRRDDLACDDTPPTNRPQPPPVPASQPEPTSLDALQHSFVTLSPTTSPDSSLSSTQSSHTIRLPQNNFPPANEISSTSKPKSKSKLLRPLSFLRSHLPSPAHSPISNSASLPASRNTSSTSLARASSSVPNSPASQSSKLPRISAEDILGTISFFRARSGSTSSNQLRRSPSPPPSKLLYRSSSAGSGPRMKPGSGNPRSGNNHSPGSDAIGGSGTKKRRASSSAFTPGAGGGRHVCSTQMLLSAGDGTGAASTSPAMKTSPLAPPKPHVRMLNGRIYGAKRYAAQTLANPFANVRDEPEFVEWGYGGMGSVHASAGIASDMWRGLQRGERGGALLAGSTFGSSSSSAPGKEAKLDARTTGTSEAIGDITVGGGRGSGAHVRSPTTRRRMLSDDVAECGMGSVGAGNGADEEDGSGMGWVKRRRAEREAKAREERETAERAEKEREGRKSPDSGMDASMSASTMSNSTSLTTSTSTTTTDLATTPATSSPASETTSLTDLSRVPSPVGCSAPPSPATATSEPSHALPAIPPFSHPTPTPKDELHVRTAVRLSPHLSGVSHKHTNSHSSTHGRAPSLSQSLLQVRRVDDVGDAEGDAPLSPVDTVETTTSSSSSSSGEDEVMVKRDTEDEEQDDEDDDEEDEAGEIATKTALGAGVEKVSWHADVEVR